MTLKEAFIEQFKATYNEENWFIPLKIAVSDVNEKEFNSKPDECTHSIRQQVNHLIFWDDRWLARIKKQPKVPFEGDGALTFDDESTGDSLENILKRMYEVMDELLVELEKFEEGNLMKRVFPDTEYDDLWWQSISNIILHNSYHVGQIMSVKKLLKK